MTRLSLADYNKLVGAPGKSKYNNNKPTFYDADLRETLTFDSNKELEYYLLLKDRQKRGEIKDLERQVSLEIQPGFMMPSGEKIRAITYKADFRYHDLDGREHIIDVKGYKTEVYKLKKKLLAYKGIYIEEV
jgi:hypothetical protein